MSQRPVVPFKAMYVSNGGLRPSYPRQASIAPSRQIPFLRPGVPDRKEAVDIQHGYSAPMIFLISLSLFNASMGVRLLMSSPSISSRT